jgi:hypothetical protein
VGTEYGENNGESHVYLPKLDPPSDHAMGACRSASVPVPAVAHHTDETQRWRSIAEQWVDIYKAPISPSHNWRIVMVIVFGILSDRRLKLLRRDRTLLE